MTMKQRSEVAADRAASVLEGNGNTPSSKAYQYLLFALTQYPRRPNGGGDIPCRVWRFLQLGLYMINRVVY